MAQAALEAGLSVDTEAGPSITEALRRVSARLAKWASDPDLAEPLEALLASGRAALDPPLARAALSNGAEIALSAALIAWPTDRVGELAAIARAQTLLAAGAKLGIAGAPSRAALDALDASARLADPDGFSGPAIWFALTPMPRQRSSPTMPRAIAPAQRSPPAHARSMQRSPISPSKRCVTGSMRRAAACNAKPPPRVSSARPMPILWLRFPALSRAAHMRRRSTPAPIPRAAASSSPRPKPARMR
ncbi:MAG: hypothetical protein WDM79_06275 [Terricaulis sp.]